MLFKIWKAHFYPVKCFRLRQSPGRIFGTQIKKNINQYPTTWTVSVRSKRRIETCYANIICKNITVQVCFSYSVTHMPWYSEAIFPNTCIIFLKLLMFKWSTDNSIKIGLKSGPGLVSVSPQTVINHSSNKNNQFVSLE